MSSDPIRLYLSASIANAPLNAGLRRWFSAPRYELILPQEFTPEVPHAELPRAIYERCLVEMERCDAGLLLLDAFGIDCAAEAGWFGARKKPLFAVASSSARFLQNWMVKGAISRVFCVDPALEEATRSDPILGTERVEQAASWAEIADRIAQALATTEGGVVPSRDDWP